MLEMMIFCENVKSKCVGDCVYIGHTYNFLCVMKCENILEIGKINIILIDVRMWYSLYQS